MNHFYIIFVVLSNNFGFEKAWYDINLKLRLCILDLNSWLDQTLDM